MTTVLVTSEPDLASVNIRDCLLAKPVWNESGMFHGYPLYQHTKVKDVILITIGDRKIFHDNLDVELQEQLKITPSQFIFLSRHRSQRELPTLTVHPIGNYRDAELGGKPKTLVPSSPRMMTLLLRLIKQHMKLTTLNFKVCYEVTHHGPFVETPSLFVEVGSTEKEWVWKQPAEVITRALLDLLQQCRNETEVPGEDKVLVGVGGGHYAPRFSDVAFERCAAFGHMVPSYQLQDSDDMYLEMFENALISTPNVRGIYFHKKALKKSQVTLFREWFENRGIQVFSSKELLNR